MSAGLQACSQWLTWHRAPSTDEFGALPPTGSRALFFLRDPGQKGNPSSTQPWWRRHPALGARVNGQLWEPVDGVCPGEVLSPQQQMPPQAPPAEPLLGGRPPVLSSQVKTGLP
jgi:hypothetical protein